MKCRLAVTLLLVAAACALTCRAQQPASAVAAVQVPGVLAPAEIEKLVPATVFFKGQTAPIQIRNAAGVRFLPAALVLTALVDTSGYSSSIQARYQAYLLTDTTLSVDGHTLSPGAYGIGFLAADQFVVMDLSGADVFLARSSADPAMRRPRPLQIVPDPVRPGGFRLYEGRIFVAFHKMEEAR